MARHGPNLKKVSYSAPAMRSSTHPLAFKMLCREPVAISGKQQPKAVKAGQPKNHAFTLMSKKVAQILHLWRTCTFSPHAVSTCFSQYVPKSIPKWSMLKFNIYIYQYMISIEFYCLLISICSIFAFWGESGLGEEVFRWRRQRPAGHDAPDILHRDPAQHPTKRCPGHWRRHRWRLHISLGRSWGEKNGPHFAGWNWRNIPKNIPNISNKHPTNIQQTSKNIPKTSQKHPKNIPKKRKHPKNIPKNRQDCWVIIEKLPASKHRTSEKNLIAKSCSSSKLCDPTLGAKPLRPNHQSILPKIPLSSNNTGSNRSSNCSNVSEHSQHLRIRKVKVLTL